jgi:hypothetical protein
MSLTQEFQLHSALATIGAISLALFLKSNLGGILAAWPFITRRYDFLKSNFQKTGANAFSFKVLHVRIRPQFRCPSSVFIYFCS